MSQIPNVNNASAGQQAFGSNNTLNELDMDDFLNLMIAELQNQDPLNPLENADLIAQISQIREVGATESLTQTLNSVLLGQNISSATNLIGTEVVALNDEGQRVSGNVRVVSITDGVPRLDLAINPTATATKDFPGDIQPGTYDYEIVWENNAGTLDGIDIKAVSTSSLADFQGAIQLNNLPPSNTPKQIFRTDRTGSGERKLVGELRDGQATTYIDTTVDDARTGDPLTAEVIKGGFTSKVTVSLSNIGEIRPQQK